MLQIVSPVKGVPNLSVQSHRHGVDGKISALKILPQRPYKLHLLRSPVIEIVALCPEGSDLIGRPLQHHRNRSMLYAGLHHMELWKARLCLLRPCRGADIPVSGNRAQKRIPNTAPYGVRLKSAVVERF